MPPPALVPVLSFDNGQPISNISVGLDATILRGWRDSSECGTSDPKFPYFGFEIQISSWPASGNRILARYSGGKLKREALYQLKGRFFVDMTKEGGRSYLHIDEAVRFQGPGTIRSYKKPQFLLVGEVIQAFNSHLVMSWTTRDSYRRDMVYEQSAVLTLETRLKEEEKYENRMCCIEGRMDGLDQRRDWVCSGIKFC
jgi:hypothetical protein